MMRAKDTRRLPGCVAMVLAMVIGSQACKAEDFLPELTAFELSSNQVRPGDALTASYEFRNAGTTPATGEYGIFVHVRPAAPGDPDVAPAFSADFRPLIPTFAWLPNTIVQERNHRVEIPKDFPPGRYNLLIGFHDLETGQRCRLANDALATTLQRYRLVPFEVLAQGPNQTAKPLAMRYRETTGLPQVEESLAKPVADDTFILGGGKLQVILSVDRPLIVRYNSADGKQLSGDSSGYPLRARIRNTASGRYSMVCLRQSSCFSLQRQNAEARYSTRVSDKRAPAASFDLVYRVEDTVLRISIEKVKEESGYQLIDVFLPQVVSAQGPTGQLIVPTQSGRLIHLDRSAPGRHVIGMNWFEADLCGAVVGDNCAAAIRTRNWDNELDAQVTGVSGRLSGGYAVRMCLRAKVDQKASSILMAETPSVDVAFVGPSTSGDRVSWVDAAKWLRRDVKGSPNPLYRDTIIYKVFCDMPGMTDYTTFEDALGIIRKVHQLAPWLQQVVYLVGWQYRGHDTGYPATDQINQRLGGIAALRRLASEAAKLNAIISYHDNFDDAYQDSPLWDESVIARDYDGNPLKGSVWAGGQSYILAFNKYARKAGLERVRRTVGQMPVRDTYHIDVLSSVPLRCDYNVQSPENTRDSLEGKFGIVREFNRLGVDVTSEGFTAPFVGMVSHAWILWREKESLFAGEEMIPFIPMIYHGGPMTYGRGNPANYTRENVLYGATYSTDWTKRVDVHDLAEPIYLVVAPWTYLRDRKMSDYQRNGDLCRVTYDKDTFVETNESTRQWRVVVDGTTVVENDLAVIRKGDSVAVYSQTARRATVSLPKPWRGKKLKVSNLCTGVDITSQTITTAAEATLDLPAREPILMQSGG